MLLRHVPLIGCPLPQVTSSLPSSATWENPPCPDITFVTSRRKEGEPHFHQGALPFSVLLIRISCLMNGAVSSVGG